MSLKNKLLSLSLIIFCTNLPAHEKFDQELSYALGVTLSKQVNQLANYEDVESFYRGFEESFLNKSLELTQEQIDYAAGMTYSHYIREQGLDVDDKLFLKGFEDSLKEQDLLISEQEAQSIITNYFENLQKEKEEKMNAIAVENENEGFEYLEKNAKTQSVVTLESGLQYKIIEKSSVDKHPTDNDIVVVHYEGRFIDGNLFDSSYQRGEPATFPVQGVIPGWTEVLQLMSPGDKWEVTIPHELAYGNRAPSTIGPNKTLIFDIELIDIV